MLAANNAQAGSAFEKIILFNIKIEDTLIQASADTDTEYHPFLKTKLGHAIGARILESTSGKVFETLNPATGKVLAYLAEDDASDVDRAVKAARSAFEGPWSTWTPYCARLVTWMNQNRT